MDIEIKYDGEFPNLCSGELIVTIDKKEWLFPTSCLSSGGENNVSFDDDGAKHMGIGPWSIVKYPKGFPNKFKSAVEDAVNKSIPYGCCGACE